MIEACLELAIACGQLRQGVIGGWVMQLHHHAAGNLKAEILMFQLVQAAAQHGRAGDQYNRNRSLYYEECFAAERRAVGGAAARSAQSFRRIRARGKPSGGRAEKES